MNCVFDQDTLTCGQCGRIAKSLPTFAECGVSESPNGPGTELKKILARAGIVATDSCSCNDRAVEMNRREQETPGWCESNLDTIVGWLREHAEERGLPFLDLAGRLLVRRAISNARRNA